MKYCWILLVAGCSALSAGCELLSQATYNAFLGPRHCWQEYREDRAHRRLAEEAWGATRRCDRLGRPYAEPFADGFVEGFADYLKYGGNGEPPALAPPAYRSPKARTPEGQAAAAEWFAGFRTGAQEARASGLRQSSTAATSLVMKPHPPLVRQPSPSEGPVAPGPAKSLPVLPLPRIAPEAAMPSGPMPAVGPTLRVGGDLPAHWMSIPRLGTPVGQEDPEEPE